MNRQQIGQYLSRIGFSGDAAPTAAALAQLQYAHLQAVPYENLDILAGRRISLDIDDLFDKVVVRRRGGFCFELNRLFGELLRDLGFAVTDYVARYWRGEQTVPKRRHQVLRVKTADGGEFLCDVGVGARIPLFPIPYTAGGEFEQSGFVYGLRDDELLGKVLTERHGDGWRDVYSFNEDVQFPCDFVYACFWCEKAPESPFNKGYMLSIRRGAERHTFDGPAYKIFRGDACEASTPDEAERRKIFKEVFGLGEEA